MKQQLQIGRPLKANVTWYDHATTGQDEQCEAEVIGWRNSQIIVRIPNYGTVRFWKKNSLEVGNLGHALRGWRIELPDSTKPDASGVDIPIPIDTDA
jgi:hypothetical protein